MAGHKFHGDIARLDNPERQKVLPVDSMLEALGKISDEISVANLGAGTGYLSIPLAKHIDGSGIVYAVDINDEMLTVLKERSESEGITNLKIVKSDENSVPIENGIIDTSFLVNVFHELEDPDRFLLEVRRFSKPVHRIIVIDWNQVQGEMGPPMHERIPEEEVTAFFRNRGYGVMRRFSPSQYEYGIVFRVATCRVSDRAWL